MTFAVYTKADGYIGEVTAPTRMAAVAFLARQGYLPGEYELIEMKD